MIHWAFVIATWAIGILGVGGTVVAGLAVVFLGPTAVIAFVEPILAKFLACTKCIVTVAFVLSSVGSYWVGHHVEASACRADEKNSELEAQRQDTINAQKAAADEANRAIDIETTSKDRHEKDLAEIAKLKDRPAPGCSFDDIDAGSRRLRIPRSTRTKSPSTPR